MKNIGYGESDLRIEALYCQCLSLKYWLCRLGQVLCRLLPKAKRMLFGLNEGCVSAASGVYTKLAL